MLLYEAAATLRREHTTHTSNEQFRCQRCCYLAALLSTCFPSWTSTPRAPSPSPFYPALWICWPPRPAARLRGRKVAVTGWEGDGKKRPHSSPSIWTAATVCSMRWGRCGRKNAFLPGVLPSVVTFPLFTSCIALTCHSTSLPFPIESPHALYTTRPQRVILVAGVLCTPFPSPRLHPRCLFSPPWLSLYDLKRLQPLFPGRSGICLCLRHVLCPTSFPSCIWGCEVDT